MRQLHKSIELLSFREILALPAEIKKEYGLLHTPHEIHQQPETWQETFEIVKKNRTNLGNFLKKSGLSADDNENFVVWLIGAGTSDYIGRALVDLLKKQWRCHVEVIPSTDLLTEMDELINSVPANFQQLWISFSRSGDSFEGVKTIEKAVEKYPQINHLMITCNKESQMANGLSHRNANVFCLILDEKVNDLGLAMTSSFSNMIVAGQCLAHLDNLDDYELTLKQLIKTSQEKAEEIASLAAQTASLDLNRICFLGSGALKSVCVESALKVMELTAGYYSVMSESFLGLRHGPLSWLDEKSLVVAFLSNNAEKMKVELGLLEELKNKHAAAVILAIFPQEIEKWERYADKKLVLGISRSLNDLYRPPLDILFGQYLGLFASLRRNLKPDSPSADGKIQRVVSEISFV